AEEGIQELIPIAWSSKIELTTFKSLLLLDVFVVVCFNVLNMPYSTVKLFYAEQSAFTKLCTLIPIN
ncbi:MAG: hypothetical protein M1390_01805, partial [Candidatus Marsarchaeota archaeon]|nr:hypothetical protein [Candidatus Marsarchaeota archaeon]